MNGVGANTTTKLTRPTVITMVIIITCAAVFFCLLGIVLWIFGVKKTAQDRRIQGIQGLLKTRRPRKA